MKHICAWCHKDLGVSGDAGDDRVSHGICTECADCFGPGPQTLEQFLERLPMPVAALDGTGEVVLANALGRSRVGTLAAGVTRPRAGDVLECANARLPGGCGHTVHCRGCTIRFAVADTYATGTPHDRVPAIADDVPIDDSQPVRYWVSTRKHGELVLLRVDDA